MITLFRFGPAWETFGCISQFVLKVETYLRMADIEFSTTSLGATFGETAPKGKLPYIDHDGTTVADSSIIVGYLEEKFDNPLDGSLDALAKAQGHVIQRMVEEHIWWLMARERWWAPENPYWHTPGLLEGVDQASYEAVRDENYRKCNEHGWARSRMRSSRSAVGKTSRRSRPCSAIRLSSWVTNRRRSMRRFMRSCGRS